jgi:uncharacterized membrane protein YidH (DUF202 family)
MTAASKKVFAGVVSFGMALSMFAPTLALAQTRSSAGTLSADDLGVTSIEQSGIKLGGGDVRQTAARIINVALSFLGIISVIIVLVGGFKYMISGGNEDKTTEAKNLIVAGIIGLAIILSAWAITRFVLTSLLSATNGVSSS